MSGWPNSACLAPPPLAELLADPEAAELDHAAWLGLLLDREATRRMDRRLQTRLRFARLRHPQACPEDIDYRTPRGLDRTLIATLTQLQHRVFGTY